MSQYPPPQDGPTRNTCPATQTTPPGKKHRTPPHFKPASLSLHPISLYPVSPHPLSRYTLSLSGRPPAPNPPYLATPCLATPPISKHPPHPTYLATPLCVTNSHPFEVGDLVACVTSDAGSNIKAALKSFIDEVNETAPVAIPWLRCWEHHIDALFSKVACMHGSSQVLKCRAPPPPQKKKIQEKKRAQNKNSIPGKPKKGP